MADSKTKTYDQLMQEFMFHWEAAAKLAEEINSHPDRPSGTQVKMKTHKRKPPRKRVYWPREL